MNVFGLCNHVIEHGAGYIQSFIHIRDRHDGQRAGPTYSNQAESSHCRCNGTTISQLRPERAMKTR